MALSYTKPNWTNDEGTAINAERLQAISNVLDGLINTDNSKAIVQITFTNADMTVTFADGTIAQFENPNKGEQGPALGARHSKSEKTTTVEIYNTETDEVVDTFYVLDGEGGGGDMTKAEYASSTFGVVKKAETANSAETANTANSATSADHALNADTAENVPWESTNHPDGLHGYHLYDEVLSLIDSTIGGAINGRY